MSKGRFLVLCGGVVALFLMAILATHYRSPTGAAAGGAGGCGGDPAAPEGTSLSGLSGGPLDAAALAEEIQLDKSVSSISPNLHAYLSGLYAFVGAEDFYLSQRVEWIDAKAMVDLYGGTYAIDSPNLPIGSYLKSQGGTTIFLRKGLSVSKVLRGLHHELGHLQFLADTTDDRGQYAAELGRVFMTMAAYAYLPEVGALRPATMVTPLPESAAEMDDYQRAYVLALHLLAKTAFDLEAAQDVIQANPTKILDAMAIKAGQPTPLDGVIASLMTIKQVNQFSFDKDYVDYVIGVVRATQFYPPMLQAYSSQDHDLALALARQLIDALADFSPQDFPLVFATEINAYSVAALGHVGAGEFHEVRTLTDRFWTRYESYLMGSRKHPAFQHRGPNILVARAVAETKLGDTEAASLWAKRALAFADWYPYDDASPGATALEQAATLVAVEPDTM